LLLAVAAAVALMVVEAAVLEVCYLELHLQVEAHLIQ
jgi:hypothetical protein